MSESTKRAITLSIALALGLVWMWSAGDSRVDSLMETRFTPDPARQVTLYTASWCGYCARARSFLDANRVVYTEIDIERSAEGRAEYKRLGGMGVPFFVIDDQRIYGLDLQAVIDALRAPPGRPAKTAEIR